MANQEQFDIIKQGVTIWNEWKRLQDIPNVYFNNLPDLSGVDLSGMDLSDVDLSWVDLTGSTLSYTKLLRADLTEACLIDANLSEANLLGALGLRSSFHRANLSKAKLHLADFSEADFSETNLNKASLWHADFSYAFLIKSDLSDANLSGANLCNADLSEANITGCRVYAVSAWNVELENTIQSNLIISDEFEPIVTVDNLEVAQFIHLLLNHKKLLDVFNSFAERSVLLLGRFSNGGLELLQVVAAKLREMKYLPIIFDFDRPNNKTYTETVKTLVGLSRFVIVDLSGPSVPQELYSTVPHYKIPFIPIIEEGKKTYAMFADLLEYSWVLPPVRFDSQERLLELLQSKVIEPAEEKIKDRQNLLKHLFRKEFDISGNPNIK